MATLPGMRCVTFRLENDDATGFRHLEALLLKLPSSVSLDRRRMSCSAITLEEVSYEQR